MWFCKTWGWRTRKGDLRTQINVIFTQVDEGSFCKTSMKKTGVIVKKEL